MKLINTDEYLLLINKKDEILNNDLAIGSDNKVILCTENNRIYIQEHWDKIIAYYPLLEEAKELDLPLLPNPYDDIKINNLAKQRAIERNWNPNSLETRRVANEIIESYKEGYKTARESDKQFTLEDMEAAVCFGMSLEGFKDDKYKLSDDDEFKGFIKSLQLDKLPKEFYPYLIPNEKGVTSPKIVINSEGKKQICGTYKW